MDKRNISPQAARLLSFLEVHQVVEPLDALSRLSIYRLSARIHELREAGVNIRTERVNRLNRFGEKVSFARYELGA